MQVKLKCPEISFVHNLLLICQIVSKLYTEHGGITGKLCADVQNDLIAEMHVQRKDDSLDLKYVLDGYDIMQRPP